MFKTYFKLMKYYCSLRNKWNKHHNLYLLEKRKWDDSTSRRRQ